MSDDNLPDVQASGSSVNLGLNRVGVTGVNKIVRLSKNSGPDTVLTATFEVYVNLPEWRKGIDMSRNMEVVDEILEEAIDAESSNVEEICGDVASLLLDRHDYTSYAEVQMEAEYGTEEQTPASNKATHSTETILASASADESGVREEIGVRVTGMTVCPCSQEMSEARAREVLSDLDVEPEVRDEFLDKVPQPGHSQRGHATLKVEDSGSPDVEIDELIEVAKDSMSARIYNLAKRPDEDHMTYHAHANAKFVEDCVRSMAVGVTNELDLDDSAVVTMRQSNDESIHQHNAYAERCATAAELREELSSDSAE